LVELTTRRGQGYYPIRPCIVGPLDFTSVNYNSKFEYLVREFRLEPFVGAIGGSI
jgi:hypothetical protein